MAKKGAERTSEDMQKDLDRATRMRDKARALLQQQGDPKATDITRFSKGLLAHHESFWMRLAVDLDGAYEIHARAKRTWTPSAQRGFNPSAFKVCKAVRAELVDPVLAGWNPTNSTRAGFGQDDDVERYMISLIDGARSRHARKKGKGQ
jgi:hypothetical protein